MIPHINPRRQQGRTEESRDEEMSLTIKQRLASTQKLNLPQIVPPQHKHHEISAAGPDHSSIQPCPPEVVFQNYSSGEVCEVPVVLRNRDKVSHLVKVTLESSPYFQLVGPSDASRKVPPGLSMTVHVLFTPGENKDYFHQLLCITDREEFTVPIRAIGARAILDFPGQLDFSECPVKYSTQKTVLVRNLGNRAAHYQLSTQSPFSVTPAMGTLAIGDSMQVTVGFQPLRTGGHSASLIVHYDTGEDTHTSLHGRAVDVDIRLDRNTVTFGKTYITRSNRATVHIHNLSNITACFQWKAADTQEQEDQLKLRQYHRLCQQNKDKLSDFLKEHRVDITSQEHSALLTHTLQTVRAKAQEDPMLFYSDIFCLEPKIPASAGFVCQERSHQDSGEARELAAESISALWAPGRDGSLTKLTLLQGLNIEGTLLFPSQPPPPALLPPSAGAARCQGREGAGSPLGAWHGSACAQTQITFVLRLSESSWSKLAFEFKSMVILLNKGPLKAPFSLLPPTTAMGSCFTFLPQEGILAPNRLQTIQISFCPTILGEFQEQFCFHVTGSPEPVALTIRGCVMGPNFHFDVPALHFGDVSFGFPHTLRCCLSNTSLAPMSFNLCIPEDGLGEPSICSFIQMFKITHPSWRKGAQGFMKPREFEINPCRGTVRALGSQDIEVTLCSNTVREYELELVVGMDGVGKKLLALPLTARCIVPPLRVRNPVVKFRHCCLKFPYEKKLTLVNESDFPGCYCVLPQEHKEKAAAWYSSSVPSGIIEAHSSVEIPITLEAQQMGECNVTAGVSVFGREGSPLEIQLECVGQGPVVHVRPREINFGTIQVLQDSSKILQLSNQTEVPAPFWVEMEIQLECVGQGPVVHVRPREINFGTIQVLQDSSKILQLSNQTEVPAPFWVEMAGKRSPWRIEPSKGVIPPTSEVSVIVTANLDDTKKFQDKVKVFIENSHTTIISVQAEGIGTTIVTDKPLAPKFDFKTCFSFTPCRYQFKMTNKGRRIHRLFWTTEGFSIFRRSTRLPALRGTKSKNVSQSPRPGSPVFKLQPLMMDLRPGQTVEMVLEGCSSTAQVPKPSTDPRIQADGNTAPSGHTGGYQCCVLRQKGRAGKEVKERLLCYATVGNETAKKQIMQVDVTCKFILPVVQMSPRAITFHVEKKPSDVLTLQYQPLSLKNTCSLPFSIVLDLEQPFQICNVDQQPLPADSKKPSDVLTLQYQLLAVKNTCSLPLDLMLEVEQPFLVCNVDQQPLPDGQTLGHDHKGD
ncbi:PREDICTED: hydrocephalus-inducing protein homolog [Ficedula albicollis]|uniref:hydrocephalus-inducing protein homolog n=1 Tax=Ficedula albicollis TaxID=59894 RepID=UPI0007AD9262|nr:PREDICTED: hydrocephalus-inducing protein homolog [Ficedula albicollis]